MKLDLFQEVAIDRDFPADNLAKGDIAISPLRTNPATAERIYELMQSHCEADLIQLQDIEHLLADEFVKDHKRSQVTHQVQTLIAQGKKVLLISTFSDTVVDYYRYMANKLDIATAGIGMAIGSTKYYQAEEGLGSSSIQFKPHNITKGQAKLSGIKRQELFRLFAPVSTCRDVIVGGKPTGGNRPPASEEIMVLIGSETLSVGQNMQDADYLINIDLPWNPIATANQTPALGRIIPVDSLLKSLTELYQNLVGIKQQYLANLDCDADPKAITTSSERLNRIQRRLNQINLADLPPEITSQSVKITIGKLDAWKDSKDSQKILRAYTDGAKSQLPNSQFLIEFLAEVDRLNLMERPNAKQASLKLTIRAVLLNI